MWGLREFGVVVDFPLCSTSVYVYANRYLHCLKSFPRIYKCRELFCLSSCVLLSSVLSAICWFCLLSANSCRLFVAVYLLFSFLRSVHESLTAWWGAGAQLCKHNGQTRRSDETLGEHTCKQPLQTSYFLRVTFHGFEHSSLHSSDQGQTEGRGGAVGGKHGTGMILFDVTLYGFVFNICTHGDVIVLTEVCLHRFSTEGVYFHHVFILLPCLPCVFSPIPTPPPLPQKKTTSCHN